MENKIYYIPTKDSLISTIANNTENIQIEDKKYFNYKNDLLDKLEVASKLFRTKLLNINKDLRKHRNNKTLLLAKKEINKILNIAEINLKRLKEIDMDNYIIIDEINDIYIDIQKRYYQIFDIAEN